LEFADGGTIFLDELGELPQAVQAKLLRTLQERKIRRVGGREELEIDIRVVAATSRDLDAMIRQGQFRQDLYYRINVVRIELPPLKNRGDDLGLLAEYFTNKHSREMGRPLAGLTPEAYQVLKQYPWPGNVRELQNVIRRALAMSKGAKLGVDDLPDEVVVAAGTRGAEANGAPHGYFEMRDDHVARFERHYLSDLLTRHAGDVPAAAREAKLPRGTLYRLLKNHGFDAEQFR
jgi:DNA-binding NtrC family response regulator